MASIFISYRRDDSKQNAGRIYKELVSHFGKNAIFIDTQKIPPGIDFENEINRQIASCTVMLVLIGTRWHDILIQRAKTLAKGDKDYVRHEIEQGLAAKHMRVIPVLLDGAKLPANNIPQNMRALLRCNAVTIHDDPYFDAGTDIIVKSVAESGISKIKPKKPSSAKASQQVNVSGTNNTVTTVGRDQKNFYVGGKTPQQLAKEEADRDRITESMAVRAGEMSQSKLNTIFMYLGAVIVGWTVFVLIDALAGIAAFVVLFVIAIIISKRRRRVAFSEINDEY